jgi:hypothetical protein
VSVKRQSRMPEVFVEKGVLSIAIFNKLAGRVVIVTGHNRVDIEVLHVHADPL